MRYCTFITVKAVLFCTTVFIISVQLFGQSASYSANSIPINIGYGTTVGISTLHVNTGNGNSSSYTTVYSNIFLTASSIPEKQSAAATISPANKPVMADNAIISSVTRSGCSSLLWFKEGTTLEYSLTDANGKHTTNTTTHIDKIHAEGPATIADFTNVYGEGKKVTGSYRCQADKLFMDMKSFLENNFSALKRSGLEIIIKQNAAISYPVDMKPGDKLEEATFVIGTKKAGKDFMTITVVIKDRKVDGFEKITTPRGSLNCLKLSQIQSTNTSMMGRPGKQINTKSTNWFSPEAGIVKTESYDANGKLQSRSELVSIK